MISERLPCAQNGVSLVKMKDAKAHFSLLVVNTLYGASHVLAKGVMPNFLSPNVFILMRVVGATLLFWLLSFFIKREKINQGDYLKLALCGLFGVAINQLFFFHGLNLSSSINSGIIMALNPIIVLILSYFLLKDKPSLLNTTGIFLGAFGAILLTWKGATGATDSWKGDVFLFINALSYAIYLVMAKPLMQRYNPLTVITWVFTFGLLFVLIFPPTINDLQLTNFNIPMNIWFKICYVVVGVTFLTYLLTMYGLKFLSPAVSSAYIYIQPILVMVFTFLFAALEWSDDYRDSISLEKIAYMLIIFVGVYLSTIKKTNTLNYE
jgi:drug/metabolite transporter (DMT)-like permease